MAVQTSNAGDIARWIQFGSALLPLLLGGGLLKYFKEWTFTEKEMFDKVRQATETVTERMAESHMRLLDALNSGKPLRGSPPQSIDHVGSHAKEVRQCTSVLFALHMTKLETEGGYNALLLTVFLGVGLLVIGGFAALGAWESFYFIIIGASILVVIIQAAVVMWLRRLSKHLEDINDRI